MAKEKLTENEIKEREAVRDFVFNAATTRSRLIQQLMDPRRDLYDECGYPATSTIDINLLSGRYERDPIANRAVNLYPDECWMSTPSLFEIDEVDVETEFEAAWKEVNTGLRKTWFEPDEDEGGPVWEYLSRIDKLCGIGRFGVLFLGLDDAAEMHEPVEPSPNLSLKFIRAFDESMVSIASLDKDEQSERYGMPHLYNISFSSPAGGGEVESKSRKVHWSRVVHISDENRSSEIIGVPRQLAIWNPLQNIDKVLGGSAEMYWRGAFPGLSIETHPQLGGEVLIDKEKMRDELEQYYTGLQRYLVTTGMSAKSLAPQVVDPTAQIAVQLEAICIQKACPLRIFKGSERGELASGQDEDTWVRRVTKRQTRHVSGRVIAPFVDALIALKILPEPKSYSVSWSSLSEMSPEKQAEIALKRTQTLKEFVMGDVEQAIGLPDWLVRVFGTTPDEAVEIVKNAVEPVEEEDENGSSATAKDKSTGPAPGKGEQRKA